MNAQTNSDEVFIENRYLQSDGDLRRVVGHLEPIRKGDFNPPRCVLRLISRIILIILLSFFFFNYDLIQRASLDLINYFGLSLMVLSVGYAIVIRILTFKIKIWWNILSLSNQEMTLYKDQRVIWHFPIRTIKDVQFTTRQYSKIVKSDNIRRRIYIQCLEIYFYRKFATYLVVFPLVGDLEVIQKDMIITKINHMAGIFRHSMHDIRFDKALQFSWLLLLAIGFILYAI